MAKYQRATDGHESRAMIGRAMRNEFRETIEYALETDYVCPQCNSPASDISDDYDWDENYCGSWVTGAITAKHAILMDNVIQECIKLAQSNGFAFIALNNMLGELIDYRNEHFRIEDDDSVTSCSHAIETKV